MPLSSHYISCFQNDLSLWISTFITWLKVVFVRFPHCKVSLFFSFLYCTFRKESHSAFHTEGVGSHALPPQGQSIYINHLEFLCMRNMSALHPLFIQPFIYLHMGYLFYAVGCKSSAILLID